LFTATGVVHPTAGPLLMCPTAAGWSA
jgi:hypothetical protein